MISNAAIYWTQVVRDIIMVRLPCTLVYKPCGTANAFCLNPSICEQRRSVFHEDKWWTSTASRRRSMPRNPACDLAANDSIQRTAAVAQTGRGGLRTGAEALYCRDVRTVHRIDVVTGQFYSNRHSNCLGRPTPFQAYPTRGMGGPRVGMRFRHSDVAEHRTDVESALDTLPTRCQAWGSRTTDHIVVPTP
jgi:hypothetical protein